MRHQKKQYFVRGVEQMKKCNVFFIIFENEEIQNVKKTIGESKISERETNVVVKQRIGAPPGSAARSKKQYKCDPHARRERLAHSVLDNNNYI